MDVFLNPPPLSMLVPHSKWSTVIRWSKCIWGLEGIAITIIDWWTIGTIRVVPDLAATSSTIYTSRYMFCEFDCYLVVQVYIDPNGLTVVDVLPIPSSTVEHQLFIVILRLRRVSSHYLIITDCWHGTRQPRIYVPGMCRGVSEYILYIMYVYYVSVRNI